MIALIQRVTHAHVSVENEIVGKIDHGLLILLGVEESDTQEKADRLAHKVLGYRVFSDSEDKMNLNVQDVGGQVLVVSQFTLIADTQKGMRPSFTKAGNPQQAKNLYEYFISQCSDKVLTASGVFGANMQVELINDGPVTFWLQV